MAWRNCNASLALLAAINARYPGRDKGSDGTIGDAAHASRSSDHNPWVIVAGVGVVRARDVDKDGVDAAWIVEELRKLGRAGDPRLAGGGYIIYNRRITSSDFSRWNVYTGSNPHDKHFHVSFSRNRAGFDSQDGWAFLGGAAVPAPSGEVKYEARIDAAPGSRTVSVGKVGPDVSFVQRWHGLSEDEHFGTATDAVVRRTQQRNGLMVDGVVGPRTWSLMGVGTAPAVPSVPPPPALPPWNLPSGHYYGLRSGPERSHGGFNANERDKIKVIQQRLVWKGYVPGVGDWRGSWPDGLFEQPTADAATRFQRAEMPATRYFGQIWIDDYRRLGR